MPSKLRLLISESHSAHFNLAVEEVIFKQMDPRQNVLFLWRNDNVVVIGRAQNPWKECNTGKMEQDNIMLARRQSGGGAVFQDLGNTCFTFMAGKPEYNKDISTHIVLSALHSLNIPAKASGRNDLIIETDRVRKISGSAYKESHDRGFHHGTLMLNVDLNKLTDYLNPDPKKLEAKGISSVRSRVTNLTDLYPNITHERVSEALIQSFCHYYGADVTPEYISLEAMPDLPEFNAQYAKQKSWAWNFGSVLPFTHTMESRFVWGGVELYLEVEKGVIINAQLYSDSLILEPLEKLASLLVNKTYHPDSIQPAFTLLTAEFPDFKEPLLQIEDWLINSIK